MDTSHSLSPKQLYSSIGTAAAPLLLDVREDGDYDADDSQIIGALRRPPDQLESWRREIPPGRDVVVYCARGQLSAGIAASLGASTSYLDGGIAAWRAEGLPTAKRVAGVPSKWVTRERPTIDRIACPWLIRRFIDPSAEFLYVPPTTVHDVANATGAVPYDVQGVEFGHHGEQCSFDAFIGRFAIADAPLARLTTIVRGADTNRLDLTPQSAGLLAVSQGLKINFADDHAMLEHGMVIYDALYAWCRLQDER